MRQKLRDTETWSRYASAALQSLVPEHLVDPARMSTLVQHAAMYADLMMEEQLKRELTNPSAPHAPDGRVP